MFRRIAVCVSVVCALALGITIPQAGAADTTVLYTTLTGANERPGPGDPDGFGRATIVIRDSANQLCLTLWWVQVDGTPSGLHIHQAPPTEAGPIVVGFTTPPAGGPQWTYQCRTIENEALLDNIAANPQQYYLNLHSTPSFGPGAIRGQLSFSQNTTSQPTITTTTTTPDAR